MRTDAVRDGQGLAHTTATAGTTTSELLELFMRRGRPSWQRDGLCLEFPDAGWFPERGEDTAPAKAICRRCVVRFECLDYALANGEKFGIWGGTSAAERRVLRQNVA